MRKPATEIRSSPSCWLMVLPPDAASRLMFQIRRFDRLKVKTVVRKKILVLRGNYGYGQIF